MIIKKILKLILKLVLGVVVLAVGVVIFLSFYKPNWKDEKIVPPLGTEFSCTEIEKEINKYGWDKEIALAIAKAESGCGTEKVGDEDLIYEENGREYGYSVGAFQVRILPGRENCDTLDLETNVKCAYQIFLDAGDFTDWSVYNDGKYRSYTQRSMNELVEDLKKKVGL